jgi:hypothetical protein
MITADQATVAQPAQLTIELVDGEDANILATLLKKHIEDIVAADPGKAHQARSISGKLGLHSTEPEASVTVVFLDDGLRIKNDIDADVDGTITGPLKLQTETLAGLANPYAAMLRRRLKIGIRWSRPLFTLQTYGFLKVPKSMLPPPASGRA